MGCYPSNGSYDPICLAVVGGPSPVGLTRNIGRYKLLGMDFSCPTKILVDFYCSEVLRLICAGVE